MISQEEGKCNMTERKTINGKIYELQYRLRCIDTLGDKIDFSELSFVCDQQTMKDFSERLKASNYEDGEIEIIENLEIVGVNCVPNKDGETGTRLITVTYDELLFLPVKEGNE